MFGRNSVKFDPFETVHHQISFACSDPILSLDLVWYGLYANSFPFNSRSVEIANIYCNLVNDKSIFATYKSHSID